MCNYGFTALLRILKLAEYVLKLLLALQFTIFTRRPFSTDVTLIVGGSTVVLLCSR